MSEELKPLTDQELERLELQLQAHADDRTLAGVPLPTITCLVAEVRRLRAFATEQAAALCWPCREGLERERGRHWVPEDGGRVSRTCDAWTDVWSKVEP